MAKIILTRALLRFTDGQSAFELEVRTVRDLFRELSRRFPAMAPHLEQGVAVAIDGQIYQDALFQEIAEDSEVHVIPQIGGG